MRDRVICDILVNMTFSKNIENMRNSVNFEFKKLQDISNVLQTKVYFLTVRATLNNFYITVTNN
jgi:hypothetical protein